MSSINYWSQSSADIVDEAKKIGIEVQVIDETKNLFVLKKGEKEILFKSTDFGGNSSLSFKICNDKTLTHKILKQMNFPVAKTLNISRRKFKKFEEKNIQDFCFPLIIKPVNDGHGNGVQMHIMSFEELYQKLEVALKTHKNMLVQEEIVQEEIRVLVLFKKVFLIINRIPAHIVGDGKLTIQQLIDKENESPLRGDGYTRPLCTIEIDDEILDFLKKENYTLGSIPKKDEYIQLRGNSNMGTGGTMQEVTNEVCDDIKKMCEKITEELDMDICGVDILTKDMSKPLSETGGVILELNATPGVGGDRDFTSKNSPKKIIETLFAE